MGPVHQALLLVSLVRTQSSQVSLEILGLQKSQVIKDMKALVACWDFLVLQVLRLPYQPPYSSSCHLDDLEDLVGQLKLLGLRGSPSAQVYQDLLTDLEGLVHLCIPSDL